MERKYPSMPNSSFRLCRSLLPILAILLSINYVLAQPHDPEHYYRKEAREIEILSERISQTPDQADLYYERAKVYLGWFQRHPKVVEYKGVVYATDPGPKALKDIERGIELSPRGEFFTLRARYYEAEFLHAIPPDLNEKAVEWREVERVYWGSSSWTTAVENYHKGLENTRSPSAKAEALLRLSDLYKVRAGSLAFYSLAKLVRAANKTRIVYEDFDRSIEFVKRYADASEAKYGMTSRIRDLYRDKARAAAIFDDRTEGLRSLTTGIDVVNGMGGDEELCSLYHLRGDLHLKSRDIPSAVRDYSYPLDQKLPNCFSAYEKRGDAYFFTGQFDLAIKDYTQEISSTEHPSDRVFLKRGRAYLSSGNAEKAEPDLSHVLRFGSTCPELRSLRAKAYRLLKKDAFADEDEKIAKTYARNEVGCEMFVSNY